MLFCNLHLSAGILKTVSVGVVNASGVLFYII